MPTLTRDMISLYDTFTHGGMDRQSFMNHLVAPARSTTAAMALLPMLSNDYAFAETIKPDYPRLIIEENVVVTGADKGLTGYLARPKEVKRLPAVVVIHENRGLNLHIKDITRRIALEGYLTFGVDVISLDGSTPSNEDQARDMIGKVSGDAVEARASATVRLLNTHL